MSRLAAPLILGLAGCAILVSLGIWQVQRLGWKQDLIARTEAMMASAPGPLPAEPIEETHEYTPVTVAGRIVEGELHALTTRRGSGPGFRVIAPFETEDGRRIMIDRGYVREVEKTAVRPLGEAELMGILHWPDERTFDTPANDVERNFWFARDVAEMAEVLEAEPVLVVVAEPAFDGAPEPLPITAAYHNRHLEYAVTWFGLALAWALMTVIWIRSRLV
ncbi:SURF1 family protein [Pontivivens ytuae]|uniref:SURF1-like protein n=1 Tax=Pontivivens ytuae TaxID=2789856 RepID=A0A7S9LUB5_9RHOB|nr:SURF1 family protein [Pontivivens ytuae]QPH55392.1 SURF1 family protein [Pontivivens ytuae]